MSNTPAGTPASVAAVRTDLRVLAPGEGEVHPVMGDPMRFLMTAEHSGGAYALSEQEVRPGNGAPPHIHHNEDEAFFVLEGEVTATVDGVPHRLSPGGFVHVPRGKVRSFTNHTDGMAKILILHAPGSAAGFYIAMGKLPFPPDLNEVKRLGDRHGIELVF
ncbi:MAG: cupin domain-containing protein [Phycisphaerales bacterium]|nr:cupin domain-containing protein [Phycisphaerales bacterium]